LIYFEPTSISEAEMKYRLENPNTEEIYVDECGNYRFGNKGFVCNNEACTGLHCVNDVNDVNELPDKCIYGGIKKRFLTLLVRT
jgi:hypothetical protein